MRALILYIVVAVAACVVAGCSEELTPTPYTLSKLVSGETSKTWKISLFEYALNDTVRTKFMEACLTDDRFKFYANTERLYETTAGRQLCFEGEQALTSSTWTFTNSNATLTMVMPIFDEGVLPFFVRELKENKMVLELFLDQENTESYRIHFEKTDEE
ncbi:lipocalin family protein [Chryseolinea sp. T2]|uniref:lipocalin family protein n=1 Tax=Chryseolinea sp. T2 TaxID=3129255 RepID=UPI00307868BA